MDHDPVQLGELRRQKRKEGKFVIPEVGSKDPTPWSRDPIFPPEGMKPTVVSVAVTASASVGALLDLKRIAGKCSNYGYPQKEENNEEDANSRMAIQFLEPFATVIIFNHGRLVVSGSKSVEDCKKAMSKIIGLLKGLGFPVTVPFNFTVQNIMATLNLGFKLSLNEIQHDIHKDNKAKMIGTGIGGRMERKGPVTRRMDEMAKMSVQYLPHVFPGVSLCFNDPKFKATVFQTGSILMTGLTSEEDMHRAFRNIYAYLKIYEA